MSQTWKDIFEVCVFVFDLANLMLPNLMLRTWSSGIIKVEEKIIWDITVMPSIWLFGLNVIVQFLSRLLNLVVFNFFFSQFVANITLWAEYLGTK